MCDLDGRIKIELISNSKINKPFWRSITPMCKTYSYKMTMGKSPNEMGNCLFIPPLATPLQTKEDKWVPHFSSKGPALTSFFET